MRLKRHKSKVVSSQETESPHAKSAYGTRRGDNHSRLLKNRTISTAANKNQKTSKRSFLSGGKIRRARFKALMILGICAREERAINPTTWGLHPGSALSSCRTSLRRRTCEGRKNVVPQNGGGCQAARFQSEPLH